MKRFVPRTVLIVALLVVAGLAGTAYQAQAWLPVMCGGDCIDLYCVPPAPPMTACIDFAGGCGSVPYHPDCANMDFFSPM